MLIRLLLQLGTLFIIATLSGFYFKPHGVTFYGGFAFGLMVQWVFYWAFSTLLEIYAALKNKELENKRIEEYSYQGLQVECPCSKRTKDFIPVRLNTPNYYNCKDCGKQCNILITTETALVTVPVDTLNKVLVDPKTEEIKNGTSK